MQNLDLKGLPRLDLEALATERAYSQEHWSDGFDDFNTLNDWVTYICMYATEAAKIFRADNADRIYSKLIKAANLALLAAERVRTGKRGRRHYDPAVMGTLTPQPVFEERFDVEEEAARSRSALKVRYRGITNDDPPALRPGGDGIPVDSNGGPTLSARPARRPLGESAGTFFDSTLKDNCK